MPHCFGQDVHADSSWLTFLQSDLLNHSERNRLLLAGFDPLRPEAVAVASENATLRLEQLCDQLVAPAIKTANVRHANHSVYLLHRGESAYPPLLALCNDAPPALFVVGDLDALTQPAVAIVGTRNPSADGCRAAGNLARDLAKAGIVVASGLAKGIDGSAHQGALNGDGRTIAVMATGIDRVYPRQHEKLAQSIARQGALVSEFPPGADPQRWHFPRRNRTLSGLTLGTVVVEAGSPSGSLITATAAAEQGREVFAYPWSIYHRGGAGCRQLLADGAQLACGPNDVVMALGHLLSAAYECVPTTNKALNPSKSTCNPELESSVVSVSCKQFSLVSKSGDVASEFEATDTRTLLQHLGDGELSLSQLMDLTGVPAAELRARLSRMELSGVIVATSLGYRVCGRTD